MNPGGLANVECVLCLDFVNTFSDSNGQIVGSAQTVARDSQRADRLINLIGHLMQDFCRTSETPLLQDWTVERGEQDWLTDNDGKYKKYSAKVDFKSSVDEVESDVIQRISALIGHYWWVIPLLLIFYNWFTH